MQETQKTKKMQFLVLKGLVSRNDLILLFFWLYMQLNAYMSFVSVLSNICWHARMMHSAARQAEIVRSNQKDEFYMSLMRGSMADIVQSLFGKIF